ncbi:pPIWI-associating nuclease domain-containing protein [Sphingobacterium multivorum]|uniref:Uncharacterized protein n=1 Tax=Sphingobacterium multivorum TaxID=28454 RepID=A0A2X2IR76_SPHMU|nr:hypothetical protein [Sphingobacterium multivorum]QRQ63462.1 hypothetical protein I6J33_11065 [Sphingobacterium multivorum]SPZ84747.1 Uncharacterised protein [Sphingobacterium multivorum]
MKKSIIKIQSILTDKFEQELFEASVSSLEDMGNKIRFNNFAYSIRELSRHFLHRLAPDEIVKSCRWFKQETENGKPSRAQRIKYAIQGGIDDELLKLFGIEFSSLQKSAKAIKNSIDSLSRYTHINEEDFNLSDVEVTKRSVGILADFETFVEAINSCREQVMNLVEDKIEDEAIDAIISTSFENVDSLAQHYSLDAASVLGYWVEEISAEEIVVAVEGEVEVTLSWGSSSDRRNGDGHEVEDTFPFGTRIRYSIGEDYPNEDPEVDEPGVDTSKWDINPDNEYIE